MKVFVIGHLPPALVQSFLQHVRNFDTLHPGCHFEMMLDAPEVSLPIMIEQLRLNPTLTFTKIFAREGVGDDEDTSGRQGGGPAAG